MKSRWRRRRFAATAALAWVLMSGSGMLPARGLEPAATQSGLTIEQLLGIAHPGPPLWSGRGGNIAFVRETDGALDLWWTTPERQEPVRVTMQAGLDEPDRVSGFAWTPAGDALLYVLSGNLYRYDIGGGDRAALIDDGSVGGTPALTNGGDRIALLRDGRPWVATFPELEGASLSAPTPGTFSDFAWDAGGRYLVALHTSSETIVEDTGSLVGDKMSFSRRQGSPADLAVFDIEEGSFTWLERGGAYAGEASFSSGGMLAWQEISADAKGRRILVAAAPDWSPRVVVDEVDEAWWTLTYIDAGPRWSPVAERFVFLSERDGWTHAYVLDAGGADAEATQLTSGEFEVEEPTWSPAGDVLLVSANRGSLTERGLYLLAVPPVAEEATNLEPISRLRGTSTFGRWRPDGELIAFLHADPLNPMDVWVQEPGPEAAQQLTDTWPEDADEEDLIRPQSVRFSSTDGELVPAQLFLPKDFEDLEGPTPVVVWVHGGGIRQNRFGWHPSHIYALFYGFHQYLLQRGYVVVTVDYRGSIGYGRAFRQGQFLDLGGRDLDDLLAAKRYLGRIEDVEIGRVGVWGISYGGYLTMQALVQAPTAFDAGVNIAGVVDWADWSVDPGGLWIDGRMESPQERPDLYRERSPIHFIERLTRPLLILHGTADGPVPVLQTFRLTDALVRAGKPFELMIYPGEQHAFVRSRTWRDAFRRTEEFFEATLR